MPPLVLLSCASQDTTARDALVTCLTPLRSVMSWWYEAALGQDVAQEWRRQRDRAACLVVLLSPDFMASDVLVQGAVAAQREGLPLIPVLLRPCIWEGAGSPFAGLQPLAFSGDWVEVARRLEERVRSLPPRALRLRTGEAAAQHLDRSKQWRALQDRLAVAEPTLFFLVGHRRQRVAFFAARVRDALEQDLKARHQVVPVTFRDGPYCPRASVEWEAQLVASLARAAGHAVGDAAQLLRRAARERPLFLIWGAKPLQQHLLEADAEAGLREFLARRLPLLLRRAALAQPVRCLVLAEYAGAPGLAMVARLRQAVQEAGAAGLPVCPLEEPRTPTWQDVEDLLGRAEPRPSARRIAALKRSFEALMAEDTDPDLNEFARLLGSIHRDDDDEEDLEEDEA